MLPRSPLRDGDDDDDDDDRDGDVVLAWSLPQVSDPPCPSHRNYTVPLKDDEGELHIEIRRIPGARRARSTWIMFRLEDADVGSYGLRIAGQQRAGLVMSRTGAYDLGFDLGFYNIGVRPTAEDLGVGGLQAGTVPLSWTRRKQGGWPLPEVANPSHVPASLNLDGRIGGIDLAMLMTVWGEANPPHGDLDGDGWVGSHDLVFLMSRWGPVP